MRKKYDFSKAVTGAKLSKTCKITKEFTIDFLNLSWIEDVFRVKALFQIPHQAIIAALADNVIGLPYLRRTALHLEEPAQSIGALY